METNIFKMGIKLKVSILGVILEGLLSFSSFLILYLLLQMAMEGNAVLNKILILTGVVVGIFICRMVLYGCAYVGSQIGGSDVSRNIRIAMGDKMKRIPLNLFSKSKSGFYINGASSEVADYEQIMTHKLADIAKLVIVLLMADIASMLLYFPVGLTLAISSLLVVGMLYIIITVVNRNGVRKNMARQDNVSNISEYITGMQTLRAYGMGGKKNESLMKAMKSYSDISYGYEKAVQPIGNIYMGISWLTLPITIYLTTKGYFAGVVSPINMILLIMMPLFVSKSNSTLMINLLSYKNLMLSKSNISKIMNEEEEISNAEEYKPQGAEIQFEHVNFSYDGENTVLKNTSFTIPDNSFTAIVGDSGSGKSTILNLIAKYYIPDGGKIFIGGVDSKAVTSEQILSYMSTVDQNVFLFNDTVRNNIRYARSDASDAEIEEACRLANCDSFIQNMKNGYETEIGENGNRLSGGERQRLSVARALIRNSPIILLDEATASLDIENEFLVKQAISNLLHSEKTVIMVAHTLPIIKNADQILVVQNGGISERGTHDELMNVNGKYAKMWEASRKMK